MDEATDQDLAIRLGRYIIQLRQRILEYEGVFMEYRITDSDGHRREIPFRDLASQIGKEEALVRLSSELQAELLDGIDHKTEPSSLIRELCRQFLDGL